MITVEQEENFDGSMLVFVIDLMISSYNISNNLSIEKKTIHL